MQDLPPEECQYQDEGCELFPSCLNCPLPRCRYDGGGGRRRVTKGWRDKEILRQLDSGKSIAELAQSFGVSKRTVQRIIRK